jgi:hypothetical protein
MSGSTVEEMQQRLREDVQLSFDESFELAKQCSRLLGREETESVGRDLLIRVLESLERVSPKTVELWNELLEASGLHPYVKSNRLRGSAAVRHEAHLSEALEGIYFHREQQKISRLLQSGRSVVVSAPTSFGKSLLIEEIVATRCYANIVIIQPTLALLDETRKKLDKYRGDYTIVVSTHQLPGPTRNIFLLTAERVVEYGNFPAIDFFVIDEFYKLSLMRDDERAITLNQALYRLLKLTKKFYFLGPNIRRISAEFLEASGAVWFHSDYATVAVDVEKTYRGKGWKARDERRKTELYSLLCGLSEPTLVYCAAPEKAGALATEFCSSLDDLGLSRSLLDLGKPNADIIEWARENIHDEWALADTLKYGIAFHHGQLPRHLGSSLVDAFNNGAIRYLFCTSTLIEGVNTTARNVVLFDRKKGLQPIDFFDYKNIVGRSGRMRIHYVGRVYEFHKEPAQEELEVDVPLFEQTNAPLELLVQLDDEDLSAESKNRLDRLLETDEELRAVVKKNSGVSLEGQIQFVTYLRSAIYSLHSELRWSAIPTYQQLQTVLELCWRFFLRKGESKAGVRSSGQLATMTLQYCNSKALSALIAMNVESDYWMEKIPDRRERVQQMVGLVLGAARHWFEYKLPKHLVAASELQAYVCRENGLASGNYSYLAALLENSFFKASVAVLLDYDVPPSAVRKLEQFFRQDEPWTTVEGKLRTMDLRRLGLLPYELQKLQRALGLRLQRAGSSPLG